LRHALLVYIQQQRRSTSNDRNDDVHTDGDMRRMRELVHDEQITLVDLASRATLAT